jgi:hypothetical protein
VHLVFGRVRRAREADDVADVPEKFSALAVPAPEAADVARFSCFVARALR